MLLLCADSLDVRKIHKRPIFGECLERVKHFERNENTRTQKIQCTANKQGKNNPIDISNT